MEPPHHQQRYMYDMIFTEPSPPPGPIDRTNENAAYVCAFLYSSVTYILEFRDIIVQEKGRGTPIWIPFCKLQSHERKRESMHAKKKHAFNAFDNNLHTNLTPLE